MKTKHFTTVVVWDKAIDIAASDLDGFLSSRDLDKLKFRDGMKATEYILRDIPNALAVRHLFNEPSMDMRRMHAFQMGVVAIRNAKLQDGRVMEEWRPRAAVDTEASLMSETPFLVSQEEVNELFALANVLDVGEVAHARCFLPPEITGGFLLPPTSRQCLTASVALFAALVDPTAMPTVAVPRPAPEPKTSDEPAADLGDVRATG